MTESDRREADDGIVGADGVSEASDQTSAVLGVVRRRLGMDVVWLSAPLDGEQVVLDLSGDAATFGIGVGLPSPLVDSRRTSDTEQVPAVRIVADTSSDRRAPVRLVGGIEVESFLCVPILPYEGHLAGMLCAASRGPMPLHSLDTDVLALFAELLASDLDTRADALRRIREIGDRVQGALDERRFDIVFQPIVRFRTMRTVGVEALVRFDDGPSDPGHWLLEAEQVGRRRDVELALIGAALEQLPEIAANCYMSVNAAPDTILDARLIDTLRGSESERVIIEINEQGEISDVHAFDAALVRIRELGTRIAIDDAGAGYAGWDRLVRIQPDMVKLGIALTADVDTDLVRNAMARSLAQFATTIGASLVAEGIETIGELATLTRLGFDAGQGYLLARPGPLPVPAITVRPDQRLFDGPLSHISDRLALHAAQSATVEEFIAPLLDRVLELTELESSYVTYLDHGEMSLEHRHVRNSSDLEIPPGMTIDWADSLCVQCRQRGITWTANVPHDLGNPPVAEAFGINGFISIPLNKPDGTTLGTMCAIGREPRYIDDASLVELEAIGRAIAEYEKSRARRDTAVLVP